MNIEKRVENMENNFKDFLSVYQQREQVTSDGLITVTNQVNKIKEERGMRLNNENNATLLSQVQGIGEKMVILEQKVLELSKENQVLKDEFSVLATRDDLQKEFTKEVRRRVMYYLKSNTSYEYILFSGTYFDNCRKHVYDIFGVPKMTRIKIDDFDLSIKAIKKWYPTQRIKDKEIQRLINLNDKGNLSKGKMRALNTYLSKTQGGIFNNAV